MEQVEAHQDPWTHNNTRKTKNNHRKQQQRNRTRDSFFLPRLLCFFPKKIFAAQIRFFSSAESGQVPKQASPKSTPASVCDPTSGFKDSLQTIISNGAKCCKPNWILQETVEEKIYYTSCEGMSCTTFSLKQNNYQQWGKWWRRKPRFHPPDPNGAPGNTSEVTHEISHFLFINNCSWIQRISLMMNHHHHHQKPKFFFERSSHHTTTTLPHAYHSYH